MNKKNKTTKVKTGKFKNPAEILRDMINSGQLKELKGGGALEILNTIAPLANLAVPGLGTGIGAATGLMQNAMQDNTTSTYGMNRQLQQGGEPTGFKQYNAPSHEMGGQPINADGMLSSQPVAEVEGTENKFTYSQLPEKAGNTYVFSDANKTSGMVSDIIRRYKEKNTDEDFTARSAMEMEIKKVEDINETINGAQMAAQQMAEQMKMKYGGNTKKLPMGGNPLQDTFSMADNIGQGITNVAQGLDNTSQGAFNTIQNNGQNTNPRAPFLDNLGMDRGELFRTVGLAASGIQALRKPDEDRQIQPDFSTSDERFNNMNVNLDQARQDVTGASNRGSELNRSSASSFGQFRARELGNISNLQDQLGRIGQSEQQMSNQILGQQGQYEMNKAMTQRNIEDDVQVRNLQNQARSRDVTRQFFSDLVSEGDRLSTARDMGRVNAAKIEEGKMLLSQLFPDFTIENETVDKLIQVSKGKLDPSQLTGSELIIFRQLNKNE